MTTTPFDPADRIATELSISVTSVRSVQKLLAEAATVPFIARYRKEQTGGLDEVQIRDIEEKRALLHRFARPPEDAILDGDREAGQAHARSSGSEDRGDRG